jgi:hypothetical protein
MPFHPPASLEPFGWTEVPDRAARLRLFTDAYGLRVEPAEILDLIVVRLTSFAGQMEREIRAGNPDCAVHREKSHADAYRAAARYILDNRASLLA